MTNKIDFERVKLTKLARKHVALMMQMHDVENGLAMMTVDSWVMFSDHHVGLTTWLPFSKEFVSRYWRIPENTCYILEFGGPESGAACGEESLPLHHVKEIKGVAVVRLPHKPRAPELRKFSKEYGTFDQMCLIKDQERWHPQRPVPLDSAP